MDTSNLSYVPRQSRNFVGTKFSKRISQAIATEMFVTIYVTGLSGMGKTHTIEQVCASAERELVRINFTEETAERHIIGGWRLTGGETVWEDGPALVAMKRGAVLLLDEVDLSSPKVMCLQPILEGSDYINKQTGQIVIGQPGFAIFATANTKGQITGRNTKFVGARAQSEAFLDRFDITIDQDYPTVEEERHILRLYAESIGLEQGVFTSFIENLIDWANIIRSKYAEGGVSEIISTRRLKSALKSMKIYGDTHQALLDTCARFPEDTRIAYLRLYSAAEKSVRDQSAFAEETKAG